MAYIGNNLTVQQYAPTISYLSGNGSTTVFTLPIAVVSAAQIIVTVANVIQNPSYAFTVSGTTLTFTSAPPAGTNNIWVEYTSLQTTANALPAYPSVTGDLVTSGGLYAKSTFTSAYTDGTVVDYSTGFARYSAGSGDAHVWYNGGVANTELMRISSAGALGVGTNSPNLTSSGNTITLNTSSAGNYSVFEMASGGTLNGYIGANNGAMYVTASGTRTMYFQTNGSAALNIDSSQNLTMYDKYFTNGRYRMYSNGAGGFGGLTIQTYNGGWADQFFIDGNGNVGVGATPSYKFQVNSFINSPCVAIGYTGAGAGFADGSVMFLGSDFQNPNSMSGSTNANFRFSTSRTGSVAASNNGTYIYEGYNSASGSRTFAVLSNGNVQNSNNSYGSLSDQTLKQDIVDAKSQWDDVKNLRVRKYRFIDEVEKNPDAKPQLGLVAQEAELISAGLIDKQIIYKQKLDADGNTIPDEYGIPEMEVDKELKTIKYSVLYMKAFKALQEAMERIEQLEADVATLKAGK